MDDTFDFFDIEEPSSGNPSDNSAGSADHPLTDDCLKACLLALSTGKSSIPLALGDSILHQIFDAEIARHVPSSPLPISIDVNAPDPRHIDAACIAGVFRNSSGMGALLAGIMSDFDSVMLLLTLESLLPQLLAAAARVLPPLALMALIDRLTQAILAGIMQSDSSSAADSSEESSSDSTDDSADNPFGL